MQVISAEQVRELLDVDELVDALARMFAELSAGRASTPARSFAVVAQDTAGVSGLLAMPGYDPATPALTTKLTSVFPHNAGGPLPVRQAVILAFDADNGAPLALLDGTYITAVRTAAASALSVRLLAREDATTLAILGTGVQAEAHARVVARVRPFRQVLVAGRDPAKAAALAARLEPELVAPVRAAATFEEALAEADVVCATTFATEPVVRRASLRRGAHVTSVGYNLAGREIDDETIVSAYLAVESRDAALDAVPVNRDLAEPLETGAITADHVRAELGELVAGTVTGRTRADELTLYKGVGVALEDAVAASLVLRAAQDRGTGARVTL